MAGVRRTEDSMVDAMYKEQGVAGGGRNVSGARMWLEVEATEDSMVDAMYKEQGCGWR